MAEQAGTAIALGHQGDHVGLSHVGLMEPEDGLGAAMSKERWTAYADVTARMSVLIPLPNLSLNELMALKPGTLLVSLCQITQDVPLLVGDVFLANVSCEPAGERLGVRINGFDQPLKG
ncbi:FliM/FliN family flagellar motor switch protein [Granulicella sibirica]|uniref:Flagellar motor switch protein FliN-like C-terminal domain-containing protein n=1 Tax=Granulicella sibirica TaxID=2479048 RepID=A0A4Q0T7A8_9BACT|nr:FliM/FliN family flagellar motor switch protein [Granulicella sibirica]RXH57909.1 hypothetical protein GRAN_1219 [Granulicella sibirica]